MTDPLNPVGREMTENEYQGRDPERMAAVLAVIGAVWRSQPDTRLGQLLVNLTRGSDLFNVEDWDLAGRAVEQMQTHEATARREGWRRFFRVMHDPNSSTSTAIAFEPTEEPDA